MTPTTTEAPTTALTPAPPAAPPAPKESSAPRITVEQLALIPDPEKRSTWISALAELEIARQHYSHDLAQAKQFVVSGKFDDLKGITVEEAVGTAMVKIQLGRSWGFNTADAMRYIYFVNGKPSIENEIVAAKLQQAGYDWDIEWQEETVEHKGKPWQKCTGCTLWLKKWNPEQRQYTALLNRQGKEISVSFTEADADHAMVYQFDKEAKRSVQIPLSQKAMFQSWARDMYYWKAIARVKKYHAPHVLRGVLVREEAQLETVPVETLPPAQIPPELARTLDTAAPPPKLRDFVMAQPPFMDLTAEKITADKIGSGPDPDPDPTQPSPKETTPTESYGIPVVHTTPTLETKKS